MRTTSPPVRPCPALDHHDSVACGRPDRNSNDHRRVSLERELAAARPIDLRHPQIAVPATVGQVDHFVAVRARRRSLHLAGLLCDAMPFFTFSTGVPATGNRQISDCIRTRPANSLPAATMSGCVYETSPNVSCRSGPPSLETVRRLKAGGYVIVLPADDAYTRPRTVGQPGKPLNVLGVDHSASALPRWQRPSRRPLC